MNITGLSKLFLLVLLICLSAAVLADDARLKNAIKEQIDAAADCEQIAYGIQTTKYDPDEIFSSCVETRAILIAMLKKYGIGQQGEINAFEKIQAYSYLGKSENSLVRQEAHRVDTAAGTTSE